MIVKTRDWANWTESYNFLINQNGQFSKENLSSYAMTNLNVDAIFYIRYDNKFSEGYYFDRRLHVTDIQFSALWRKYLSDPKFVQKVRNTGPLSAFMRIDNRLLLIGAAPVHKSDGTGRDEGILVIGRHMAKDTITNEMRLQGEWIVDQGPDGTTTKRIQFNQSNTRITLPVSAHDGAAVAWVQYWIDRDLIATARSIQRAAAVSIFMVVAILPLIISMVVRKRITAPISKFKLEMRRARKTDVLSKVDYTPTEFELGDLKNEFNQLIDRVARSRLEKMQAIHDAENALQEAQKAQRIKSDFLAMMSHEIRTPLTAMLGTIDLMSKDKSSKNVYKNIDILKKSSLILNNTINDILDFSKLNHSDFSYNEVPTDIDGLVRDVVDTYSVAANAKGLELTCDLTDHHPQVATDPVRLQQVLGNLIGNAIKFTDHGQIKILATMSTMANPDMTRWRFEVQDTGIGISPALLPELFKPFTQAHFSTTRRFGGTGLGLSICKRIIEGMRGQIGATNNGDSGSIFWFELDLPVVGAVEPSNDLPPSQADRQSRNLKVLVVEDDLLVQDVLIAFLLAMGHDPHPVSNGRSAIEAVEREHFDAVLMDMHMPEMGGIEAMKLIKALPEPMASLPVIALTADADPSRRHLYDDAGFFAFLTKPFTQTELAAALASVS
jgi:signal transduction histidine kinase